MLLNIVRPLLWSFLPGQVAHQAVPLLSTALPFLLPPAPRGSPGYVRNFRLVFTAIVVVWMAYKITTTGIEDASGGQAARDYYEVMGVGARDNDDQLRRAFRHLSRAYHPDRAGQEHADKFIIVRQAYETLTDPAKRYAYDRFGPAMSNWQKVESVRDYVQYGAFASSAFYGMTAGVMVLMAIAGRLQDGAYWRWVLLFVSVTLEAALVFMPTPALDSDPATWPIFILLPPPLARLLSRLVPRALLLRPQYQTIAFLRRTLTEAGMAITQLASVWSDPRNAANSQSAAMALQIANRMHQEALVQLGDEIGPLLSGTNDPAGVEANLLDRMTDGLLVRTLAHHPVTAPAWKKVYGEGMAAVSAMPASASTENPSVPSTSRGITRPNGHKRHAPPTSALGSATPAQLQAIAKDLPLPPSRQSTPGLTNKPVSAKPSLSDLSKASLDERADADPTSNLSNLPNPSDLSQLSAVTPNFVVGEGLASASIGLASARVTLTDIGSKESQVRVKLEDEQPSVVEDKLAVRQDKEGERAKVRRSPRLSGA